MRHPPKSNHHLIRGRVEFPKPTATAMTSNEVTTRREMADLLESVMTSSYDRLKDELRLERNHSLLKTYIVEAHLASRASHDDLYRIISQEFKSAGRKKSASGMRAAETKDADLFVISGSTKFGVVSFFIDTTDPRFWLAHALSKSDTSDQAMNGVISGSSALDTAWMPIELLESVMKMGESRGIGLDFDRRYLDHVSRRKGPGEPVQSPVTRHEPERNPVNAETHLEYAKLQLWGNGADKILSALKTANLENSTTLSKVRLRNADSADDNLFALSDIKFDGKVTGRGSSFDTYNSLLVSVRDTYADTIRKTENTFQLSWEGAANPTRLGEPFHIFLGRIGVTNLEHFCARIFSGADPFRLMALPIRRNADFYTASAVDLHVNQTIDFEISRNYLTAYLPKHACGNTLLRLYTNLQHYFSSDVKAVHGSGETIFSF